MKQGKVICLITAVAMTAGLFAGCGSTSNGTSEASDSTASNTATSSTVTEATASSTSGGNGKAYNIGYSNMALKEDFFITVEKGISEACAEKGYTYNTAISDRDSTKMVQNIEALVTKGADIIIDFNVLPETGASEAEKLKAENIPLISIDCDYGDDAYFFGVDNEAAGKQLGESLEKFADDRFGGKVDYVVALWDSQSGDIVKLRCSGATDELQSYYGLSDDQIVWIDSMADDTKTQTMTKDWLDSHPDAHHVIFVGQNDDRGYAINQAVIAADRTADCIIGSHNADPSATDNLKAAVSDPSSTSWVTTISYNSNKYGEQIIDYATDILNGNTTEKKKNAELTTLTTDNIEDYLSSLNS